MNSPQGVPSSREAKKAARRDAERKALPFLIEFVKFSATFAVIIAVAFLVLSATSVIAAK